jgi:hypothetical protein
MAIAIQIVNIVKKQEIAKIKFPIALIASAVQI